MYVKLFAQILDSLIRLESGDTRIVWITLLAAMDADGFARFAAVENLARRANVALEAAEIAVQTLEAPDPRSSDPDNEGRRIERVPGGWLILNAVKYRRSDPEINRRERTRERVAQWRKNQSGNADVTPRNDDVTKSNAMKKKKKKQRQTEKQKHTASDSNGSVNSMGLVCWRRRAPRLRRNRRRAKPPIRFLNFSPIDTKPPMKESRINPEPATSYNLPSCAKPWGKISR